VKIFVEGGGATRSQQTGCRRGFRAFVENAGHTSSGGYKVIACGSREQALADFQTCMERREDALLLVDSEGPIISSHQKGNPASWKPWQHLRSRDGSDWKRPTNARDIDCHLMVECMENWLLADPDNVREFFGQGFIASRLPSASREVESISKNDALRHLTSASEQSRTKGCYNKAKHSFELLATTNAQVVIDRSPWARRFVQMLGIRVAPES
jgi:Domain of unknown function (DUF4276)